jgi:hypothetical protein
MLVVVVAVSMILVVAELRALVEQVVVAQVDVMQMALLALPTQVVVAVARVAIHCMRAVRAVLEL